VPYLGWANFTTSKGTITDHAFFSGSSASTLTNLTSAGTATVSSTVDHQTVSVNVLVSAVPTIAQIVAAAGQVKLFYEFNGFLPANVVVGAQTVTMPQFLQLLVTATVNISQGNLNPINTMAVANPTHPSGTYTHGNLVKTSYVVVARNIKNFIDTNGRAPNYAQTTLGKIPYSKLVYMYSKVINFYGNIIPNRLPNYVYI
ncbi:MAG: hypothetical protein LLF83_07785, partial [Methanobacterium sp.]|nr:hypothetical protein [Methanobacterium sp.]